MDKMVDSQAFYAEALSANLQWNLNLDVKKNNFGLLKDLQVI
jgi:hypothetical protein